MCGSEEFQEIVICEVSTERWSAAADTPRTSNEDSQRRWPLSGRGNEERWEEQGAERELPVLLGEKGVLRNGGGSGMRTRKSHILPMLTCALRIVAHASLCLKLTHRQIRIDLVIISPGLESPRHTLEVIGMVSVILEHRQGAGVRTVVGF